MQITHEINDTNYAKGINWFIKHVNHSNVPFTLKDSQTNITLISPAQGIYKPANSVYALSVKQTLKGLYDDQHPYYFEDGSCLYLYHQETREKKMTRSSLLHERETISGNAALNANLREKKPVGVVIQTATNPARYDIKLSLILGWINGFYILYCVNDQLTLSNTVINKRLSDLYDLCIFEENTNAIAPELIEEDLFDPQKAVDARKKVQRSLVQRQGQGAFRANLLKAYSNTCAITGSKVIAVLEAAHITPYMGVASSVITNGILLRSDIHSLWDQYLIHIDPITYKIVVSDGLKNSEYFKFNNQIAHLPVQNKDFPSINALSEQATYCTVN